MNRARRPAAGSGALAACAAAVIIGVAGCAGSPPVVAQGPTAKMERIGNSLSVVLTPLGAARIGVQTTLATTGTPVPRRPADIVIPYAALLYEKDGSAFVYTNPSGLTYVRAHIEIERVAGQDVVLRAGPAAGTRVVTTGVPQIHGAELEYGEY